MDRGVSEIQTGSSLGRGVIASRDFENGEFVVEYAGHYVHSKDEFTNRMNEHDKAGRSGSFVFWFRHQESWHWYVMMFYAFFHLYFFKFWLKKCWWQAVRGFYSKNWIFQRIDATVESGRLGRLINHMYRDGNIFPRKIMVDGFPKILFYANQHIAKNTQLFYDYGEDASMDWPWMRMSMIYICPIFFNNLFQIAGLQWCWSSASFTCSQDPDMLST